MKLDIRFRQAIGTIVFLLSGLLLLTGCASSVAFNKQDRESIRSVSVGKDIKVADDIYYQGAGQSVGMAFGLLGALIGEAAAQEPKNQLKAAIKESQINPGHIVREQFANKLVETNIFPAIVPEGGDAEIRLEVNMLGFAQADPFSNQLKPMLGVSGSLARKDGTVLWEKNDFVANLNEQTPAHTLEEYLQNPQFIREAFTVAAKIVSDELIEHMRMN